MSLNLSNSCIISNMNLKLGLFKCENILSLPGHCTFFDLCKLFQRNLLRLALRHDRMLPLFSNFYLACDKPIWEKDFKIITLKFTPKLSTILKLRGRHIFWGTLTPGIARSIPIGQVLLLKIQKMNFFLEPKTVPFPKTEYEIDSLHNQLLYCVECTTCLHLTLKILLTRMDCSLRNIIQLRSQSILVVLGDANLLMCKEVVVQRSWQLVKFRAETSNRDKVRWSDSRDYQ